MATQTPSKYVLVLARLARSKKNWVVDKVELTPVSDYAEGFNLYCETLGREVAKGLWGRIIVKDVTDKLLGKVLEKVGKARLLHGKLVSYGGRCGWVIALLVKEID